MKNLLLGLGLFWVKGAFLLAQGVSFEVGLSHQVILPGDTLAVTSRYILDKVALPPATVAIVVKHQASSLYWFLRWPLLEGKAAGNIVLPTNCPAGAYSFFAAVQPRYFSLRGTVTGPTMPPWVSVSTTSINDTVQIPVVNGRFELRYAQLTGASFLTIGTPNYRQPPAISLETPLDSTFEAAATFATQFLVGPDTAGQLPLQPPNFAEGWPLFQPYYAENQLSHLPPVEIFDSLYVRPEFRQQVLRTFNFLNDSTLQAAADHSLLKFLRQSLPGFYFDDDGRGTVIARSKGVRYALYVDHTPATAYAFEQMSWINLAQIKLLAPTTGLAGQDAARADRVLAFFTRRGKFVRPNPFQRQFIVQGFSPATLVLTFLP